MVEHLTGDTRLYPIIGDPVAFVKSPQTLSAGFAARGKNALCIPMQVAKGDLAPVMDALARTRNVEGLLITMPHKVEAFRFCASSDRTSALLGCVSVMRRNADGTWHGGMLDGQAFLKAQVDQGAKPHGARALLIGAGAAGSAIAVALLEAKVGELVVCDSEPSRAAGLIAALDRIEKGQSRQGSADPAGFDLVCHATPMGLNDTDPLPIDVHRLQRATFVGDVIAGHGTTPLIQAARRYGCGTATGAQMVDAVQEMMLDFLEV